MYILICYLHSKTRCIGKVAHSCYQISTWLISPPKFLSNKFGSVPHGCILNALMTFCLIMTTCLIVGNGCKRIFVAKKNEIAQNKLTLSKFFKEDIESVKPRTDGEINTAEETDSIKSTLPPSVRLP